MKDTEGKEEEAKGEVDERLFTVRLEGVGLREERWSYTRRGKRR